MEEIHLRNLLATAKNLIGVIESKQWERIDSKTWALKNAIDLIEGGQNKVEFLGPVSASFICCPNCSESPIDLPPHELLFGLKVVCVRCSHLLRDGKLIV